ncbi:MAG: hypothetical protein ACLQOO_22900 [Terriglobia bacterium]
MMMESEVSTKRVVANQANCQKSTGPKSPEGKARASLNALKTGAYAKTDHALRQIMLRRGENPADFEQLHEGLTADCHPDDLMQAMVVKTIAEKSFDKANLRAAWMESQLTDLQVGQIQAQRRQLRARRWLLGTPTVAPDDQPLWLEKDRPNKFKRIFDLLDCLQKWFDARICPDEYPATMGELYGEFHSQAGEKIRTLFIQLFDEDDKAGAERAAQELPKWIAQERRDVQQERDLYQKEMGLRAAAGPALNEDQVAKKEAAIEKQIREQTRLLLQLKRAQFREQGTGDREQSQEKQGTGDREQGIGRRTEDPGFKTQENAIATETGTAQVEAAFRPASQSAGQPSGADAQDGNGRAIQDSRFKTQETVIATETCTAHVEAAFRPASSQASGQPSGTDAQNGSGPGIQDSRFRIQETAIATNGPANGPKGEETVVSGAEIAEKREKRSNEASQVL